MSWTTLDTPAGVVDMRVAQENIRAMIDALASEGIAHRPHIKVHKCAELAKMQLNMGAIGITCAKVSEAEAMVDAGVEGSILIANEVIGDYKCDRLIKLGRRADVISAVDSGVGAQYLDAAAKRANVRAKACIEVDIGVHRCGVSLSELPEYYRIVSGMPNIDIVGIMGYSALAYGKQAGAEMRDISLNEHRVLTEAARIIEGMSGKPLRIVSGGCSLSSRYPEVHKGITESRAGNYIFNDNTAIKANVCTPEQCAFYVVATIISIPERGRLLADAGTKTLSSDSNHYDGSFGYVMEYPEMDIYKLNEEHAYIKYPHTERLKIGEKIRIIPNHSCVVPNLLGEMWALYDDNTLRLLAVEARGAVK